MTGRVIGFNTVLLLIGGMVPALEMPVKGASCGEAKGRFVEAASTLSDYDENTATTRRYREHVHSVLTLDLLRANGP